MPCNCVKKHTQEQGSGKGMVLAAAKKYQQKNGGIIVFFRCNDYDFTEIEHFNPENKTEIEYLI